MTRELGENLRVKSLTHKTRSKISKSMSAKIPASLIAHRLRNLYAYFAIYNKYLSTFFFSTRKKIIKINPLFEYSDQKRKHFASERGDSDSERPHSDSESPDFYLESPCSDLESPHSDLESVSSDSESPRSCLESAYSK